MFVCLSVCHQIENIKFLKVIPEAFKDLVECYSSSGLHSVSYRAPLSCHTAHMVNGGIKIIHVTLIRDILRVNRLIFKSFPRHNNYDKKKYKIFFKNQDHTCTYQTASKKRLNIKIPLASAHWLIKNLLTQCTLANMKIPFASLHWLIKNLLTQCTLANIKIPLASAHWLIKNLLTQCTLANHTG